MIPHHAPPAGPCAGRSATALPSNGWSEPRNPVGEVLQPRDVSYTGETINPSAADLLDENITAASMPVAWWSSIIDREPRKRRS
jgi:hypothetical protein